MKQTVPGCNSNYISLKQAQFWLLIFTNAIFKIKEQSVASFDQKFQILISKSIRGAYLPINPEK